MNKEEISNENYEIVKIEKRYGEFQTADGKILPFANYYVHFKRLNNPLIMIAKVEKVFRDYVEDYDTEE